MDTPPINGDYSRHELCHIICRRWYVLSTSIKWLRSNLSLLIVTFMFCIGNVEDVAESPTGQPYIAVILIATNSVAAAKVIAVVILVLIVSCSINGVTTTSRLLW